VTWLPIRKAYSEMTKRGRRRYTKSSRNPPPTTPPTKAPTLPSTRYVPPQPIQRFQDPGNSGNSDDMEGETQEHPINVATPAQTNTTHDDIQHPVVGVEGSQWNLSRVGSNHLERQSSKRPRTSATSDDEDDEMQPHPLDRMSVSPSPPQPPGPHHHHSTPTPGALKPSSSKIRPTQFTMRVDPPTSAAQPSPPHPSQGQNHPRARTSTHTLPPIPDANITGFAGENPLTGLLDPVKISWIALKNPKLLAYPHGYSHSESEKLATANSIQNAISERLPGHRPKVTSPTAAPNQSGGGGSQRPWCYLITGLSEEDMGALTALEFISNANASIHILPFTPPPSDYVARIMDLTFAAGDREAVIDLIKKSIRSHESARSFMEDFITNDNDRIPPDILESGGALEWIIDSVQAYHVLVGGDLRPDNSLIHWRWYIHTPTSTPERALIWTRSLLQLEFNAVVDGYGRHTSAFKCRGCKSTSHSDEECPFPKRAPLLRPSTVISGGRDDKRPRGKGPVRGRAGRKGNSSRN